MVKKFKFNIKNDQLARVLNIEKKEEKKGSSEQRHAVAVEKSPQKMATVKTKRKARIVKTEPLTPIKEDTSVETVLDEDDHKDTVDSCLTETVEHPEVESEALLEKVEDEQSAVTEADPKQEIIQPEPVKESVNPVTKPVQKPFKPAPKYGFKDFKSKSKKGTKKKTDVAQKKQQLKPVKPEVVHAPSKITVRLPILLKDLAQAMKKKASELISKLFMQGLPLTINDYLDDETTVQLIGQEFNCEITIDAREEEKTQLAEHSIEDEIKNTASEHLQARPPVITFMGHVDHGKTTLVDSIRKSNTVANEFGSITQHIGAFTVSINDTKVTVLDTPGHEDFTVMRQRGANVTDIVVLVIAGNEGVKEQTVESINSARNDNVPIIVAINKKDKDGFNLEKVYKELTEHDLVPEAWGGDVITATCSALTGDGVEELLEMVLLQAELLDIKANYNERARGSTLR